MSNRVISILVIVLLVAGSFYSAWLFLKKDIIVTLSEGQVYDFKNFEIKVEKIFASTCGEVAGFECTDSGKDFPGVQLRVLDKDTFDIAYEFLSEEKVSSTESKDINFELLGLSREANRVELDISIK